MCLQLVTDVPFVWSYPAKSAFVTGTFCNWEDTVPMTLITGVDGPIWVLSKALPPGEYQYKCKINLNLSSPTVCTCVEVCGRLVLIKHQTESPHLRNVPER